MIERLLRLVSFHPVAVIAVMLVLTALAGAGLVDVHTGALKLAIDPSVDRLLPQDDPDRQFYDRVRTIFGKEDAILVAITTDDVFTRPNIDRIARITERLQELPEVHHVLSLATAPNLRVGEETLDVGTVVQQIDANPGLAGQLRKDVLSNPLYSGSLVSADGRVAAVLVYLKDISDRDFLDRDIEGHIARIAKEEAGDTGYWLTGSPVVKAAATRALLRELAIAIPAIALISAVLLLIVFRAASAVILPMVTIVLALVWTLGTLSWLGRPLNLVTTIVPPLIITMGLAFSMYVLAEYSSVLAGTDSKKGQRASAQQVLAGLALPLSITSLTGITGFLALLPSPLAATREFAWLSALGVFYIWILAMIFLPAALSLIGPRAGEMPVSSVQVFKTLAARLSRFHIAYRRNILIGSAVVLLIALAGVANLRSGTNFINDFSRDSPVRLHYEAVSRSFGGANTFYVVIDGGAQDAIVEPTALEAIKSLQEWLAQQPEIGKTTSVVDYLKVIQRGFGGDASGKDELPGDRRLIKQLLVFGGGDDVTSVVDRGFRTANIIVRTNVDDTAVVSRLMQRIQPHLEALPAPLHGRATGSTVLIANALDKISRDQMISVTLALTAIFLIMAALFTSYRAAFLGLLPNILPIAIYFGTLGFLGITLNPTTSLIACIVLGVAANDTILYFVRFNGDARRSASEAKAAFSALQDVLRPITYTAAALGLGFLVLTTSELHNQVQFGFLASFTIVAAWIANVVVTPALAAGVRIVTLWDVLRLDLGHDPQHSIPLMRDLNLRQARIFALLSDIMNLKAGSRVITEGEMGDDMYVVIDGRLRVYLEREGGSVDIDTFSRGATLGEIGYFVHKRTANVDAVTDVRLLRFNEKSLERLRRWRPWIAAIVYRNLNRIQAERLARTTNLMR